jgi:hypothetical protein
METTTVNNSGTDIILEYIFKKNILERIIFQQIIKRAENFIFSSSSFLVLSNLWNI